MINCKSCGAEIASSAKTCPSCGAKNKKAIYKKWWFWTIIAVVLIAIASNSGNDNNNSVSTPNQTKQTTIGNTQKESFTVSESISQKNAVRKAKSYLNISGFSYSGLIEQLEFEKFSHEDAVYGADNCGANWNEQAAKKAKQYIDISSFSREGLIEQLEFEGFTHEQAVYGVEAIGF